MAAHVEEAAGSEAFTVADHTSAPAGLHHDGRYAVQWRPIMESSKDIRGSNRQGIHSTWSLRGTLQTLICGCATAMPACS